MQVVQLLTGIQNIFDGGKIILLPQRKQKGISEREEYIDSSLSLL